jgi:hypothetical protein
MPERGRATHDYNRMQRGYHERQAPVLGFSRTWRFPGFRCTSRATGLTCVNRAGHGWWLGRFKGYWVF